MSETKRDPRVDPKPGDVVCYVCPFRRVIVTVRERSKRRIYYQLPNWAPQWCRVGQWRKWMRGARVLQVAEQEAACTTAS